MESNFQSTVSVGVRHLKQEFPFLFEGQAENILTVILYKVIRKVNTEEKQASYQTGRK